MLLCEADMDQRGLLLDGRLALEGLWRWEYRLSYFIGSWQSNSGWEPFVCTMQRFLKGNTAEFHSLILYFLPNLSFSKTFHTSFCSADYPSVSLKVQSITKGSMVTVAFLVQQSVIGLIFTYLFLKGQINIAWLCAVNPSSHSLPPKCFSFYNLQR